MNMKTYNLLFSICFLFTCIRVNSQDIHFSQFYESPILLNPAAAGAGPSDYRFTANYKNQWKSVMNPFKTMAIGFDTKIKSKSANYFGVGVSVFNDKVGASKFTTNQVNIDLAYHFKLNEQNRISAAVKSGVFEKHFNPNGLKWDNQYDGKEYDPSRSSGELISTNNYMKFDLGAGLLYTYKKENGLIVQAGGAVAHLTKPKNSFYAKDPSINFKYTGHIHIQYQPKEKKYIIQPSVLFVNQGGHTELVGGSNIALIIEEQKKEKDIANNVQKPSSQFHFGAFYRLKDAVIFVAGIEYRKAMRFGVSYDLNLSRLTAASKFRGGPELSFVYFGFKKEKKKPEVPVEPTEPIVIEKPQAVQNYISYNGIVYGNDIPVGAQISVSRINDSINKKDDKAYNNFALKEYHSDSVAGKYKIVLNSGTVYKINISAPGYEPIEEIIDETNSEQVLEKQKDFHLKKIMVPDTNQLKPQNEITAENKNEQKEAVSPCSDKALPDLNKIKNNTLNTPENYNKILSVLGDYCASDLVFKIQIAAYRKPQNYNFNHIIEYGKPEVQKYPDGITRFTMSEFKTINEAEVFRQKLLVKGQKDAWIVSFKNGKRLTLNELIKVLSKP